MYLEKYLKKKEKKKPPAGLEPAIPRLEVWCLVQLGYGGK